MTTALGRPEATREQQNSASPRPLVEPAGRLPALAIVLVVLLGVGGSGCGGGDSKPASARANVAQVVPVSVATAERRDVAIDEIQLGAVNRSLIVSDCAIELVNRGLLRVHLLLRHCARALQQSFETIVVQLGIA